MKVNFNNTLAKVGKFFSKSMVRKSLCLVVLFIAATPIFAATTSSGGVNTALQDVTGTFNEALPFVQNLIYALAAICALVGSFTIFFKMTNGDQDVKKTIMLTVGGCAGLVGLATALPKMFPTT